MTPRRLAALTAAIILCLSIADGAAPEKTPYESYLQNSLSFSALKLGLANRVGQLQADGANRVWATTDKGVAAILVDQLAPFFPLTAADLGTSADVGSVAFGKLDTDENFFLGYPVQPPGGIQYGKVLSDTGLQPKPPTLLARNEPGDPGGVNLINGLSTNGNSLWAATVGGLVEWVLGGPVPVTGTILLEDSQVSHVATDPWAAENPNTVYSSGRDLFVVPSENSFDTLPSTPATEAPVAFAFDRARTLWVATGATVYRYPVSGDPARPYGPRSSRPGPAPRTIKSIAVDPLNPAGTVIWVGTDRGAFFQIVGPSGDLTADGWVQADTGSTDTDVKVYVDPSGNLWFGSDFGIRSLLSRLVTINSTRFVGYGAQGVIDLLDVNPNAPGPAPESPPETLTVAIVKKGSTTPELTLTASNVKTSDGQLTSNYSATFTFATTTVPGQALGVTSSTENVIFEVAYEFGPVDDRQELPRPAFSWANIVKFEDDAWIGGPCFLNTLGR